MKAIPRNHKKLEQEDIQVLIETSEIAEKKLYNHFRETGNINEKMFKFMMRVEEAIANKEL